MRKTKGRPSPKLNQALLERRCRYWQKILRLQDWTIKLTIERPENMLDNVEGECSVTPPIKLARIKILHPDHYPTTQPYPQDWEGALVHEMLHIHIEQLGSFSGARELLMEQAIESIAQGLIELHRRQ